VTARRNPYVGLVPYTQADAEWFFGRDQEVRLITANLRAARLTLLYGASGVGKSSVLLAGVLPRLQSLVAEHRPVAAGDGRGTLLADRPPIAVTVFREWRDPPLAQLAAGMHSAVVDACDDEDIAPWDGVEPFADWLRMLTSHARTLLVVLDQFEEYFQYHPDEIGPGTFATEFPAVVNDRDLRVHFLMSLREDAWSRLDRFKGEIPELFGNYLRIDYLDRGAAHEAIVKPLEHYNDTAEVPVTIAPELVDAILSDVRTGRLALAEGQPTGPGAEAAATSDERVETPYLQLVMERLWAAGTADGGHALTPATLEELGGAASIVSSHLTDAMAELSADDQATAADVFGFLVTPSKTKIAHRASDLAYWAQRPEEDVRRVLDDLASGDRRILRRVPPPGDEEVDRYEIFHDVLADAVLEWSGENRQQRQRAAARQARRRARRRRALQILGVVALIAAAVVVVLVIRHQLANSEEARDERQSRALARQAETELAFDSERSLLYAVAAFETRQTPQAKQSLAKAYAAARARAAYVEHSSPKCPVCAPRSGARAQLQPVSLARSAAYVELAGSSEQSESLSSLSHDGKTLAIVRGGHVDVWRPATGVADTLPDVSAAAGVAFIGDGARLVILTKKRQLLLGSADGGAPRPLADRAGLAAVSADGRYLATSSGRTLRVGPIADLGAGKVVQLSFSPGRLAFSPRDAGLLVITPAYRSKPSRWHWREEGTPSAARGKAYALCPVDAVFSGDGRTLVTTAPGGRIFGWSMPGLRRSFVTRPIGGCASVVRVDRHGSRVLVASDNVATVLDGSNGKPLVPLGGHTESISGAAFSPSGALVATVAEDGSARVWDADRGRQLLDLRARGMSGRVVPLSAVAFTPDERFVVTTDEDGVARVWDVRSRTPLGAWSRRVRDASVVDDGRVLAALSGGRIVSVTADGDRTEIMRLDGRIGQARFAAGGTRALVVLEGRRRYALWSVDLADHTAVKLDAPLSQSISLTADGHSALIWGRRHLRIWRDGRPEEIIRTTRIERLAAQAGLGRAMISDRGERVLIVLFYRGARVIDMRNGGSVRLRGGAAARFARADFNEDGSRLVTTGDRGVFVWDTSTGKVIPPRLGENRDYATSVAYSLPHARNIAFVDANGSIHIFDAGTHLETASLVGRPGIHLNIGYSSDSKVVSALVPFEGLELARCEVCETPDWLARHAVSRLARSRDQAREFIRKAKEG
jgi:WD40 repeat protein